MRRQRTPSAASLVQPARSAIYLSSWGALYAPSRSLEAPKAGQKRRSAAANGSGSARAGSKVGSEGSTEPFSRRLKCQLGRKSERELSEFPLVLSRCGRCTNHTCAREFLCNFCRPYGLSLTIFSGLDIEVVIAAAIGLTTIFYDAHPPSFCAVFGRELLKPDDAIGQRCGPSCLAPPRSCRRGGAPLHHAA